MVTEIRGGTAAEVYEDGLQKIRVGGREEASRNGPVLRLPGITVITLDNPMCRVLDDPIRNANPFFHVMEFVWMMAGRKDAGWIAQFNKRMHEYADGGEIKAAYGYRWRNKFVGDQIVEVIRQINENPTTRQAVLQMWNPTEDLWCNFKDKACNTQIVFSPNDGKLDMIVYNRSNDFVWGAAGANIVHMTLLHEFVSCMTRIQLGKYQVVSANMHVYKAIGESILHQTYAQDVYNEVSPAPLFENECQFPVHMLRYAEYFCSHPYDPSRWREWEWLHHTAYPIYNAWEYRKTDANFAFRWIERIKSDDWRIACKRWMERYVTSSSSTSTGR